MPPAKVALGACLTALAVAACGTIDVKPHTPTASGAPGTRGHIDDPRTAQSNHVRCLRADGLRVAEVGGTDLQIGAPSIGPYVRFEPTPGTAQGDQIKGIEQGAEVIGSALLYPRQASDSELKMIETCLAQGVTG